MNDAQMAALAAELKAGRYAQYLPSSPGIVADMLNAMTDSMVQPLTAGEVYVWAAPRVWAVLKDASEDMANPVRSPCMALREAVMSGTLPIHAEAPELQAMFDGMRQAGVITQDEQNSLMAKAVKPATRCQVLGLPPVTVDEVIAAWQL